MVWSGPAIPIHEAEWLAALHELSLCCAGDAPDEASDRTRELNQLLSRAPDISMVHGLRVLGLAPLEAMLRAHAAEAAIMAMFQHGASYMVSRGGDGQSLATVVLPNSHREQSGAGATPALALIGAVALSLAHGPIGVRVPARRVPAHRRAVFH